MRNLLAIILVVFIAGSLSAKPKKETQKMLTIKSPAFKNQVYIPAKYSCDGENVNPPLTIENIPPKTESLALIVDDPDAPMGAFDHWIVFNISPQEKEIKEEARPEGGVFGKNSAGGSEYIGPCPPPGKPHRYFFKLYALDAELDLKEGARKKEVEKAMEGHILAQASLVGLFKR